MVKPVAIWNSDQIEHRDFHGFLDTATQNYRLCGHRGHVRGGILHSEFVEAERLMEWFHVQLRRELQVLSRELAGSEIPLIAGAIGHFNFNFCGMDPWTTESLFRSALALKDSIEDLHAQTPMGCHRVYWMFGSFAGNGRVRNQAFLSGSQRRTEAGNFGLAFREHNPYRPTIAHLLLAGSEARNSSGFSFPHRGKWKIC
jgi:hypothetical protein